MRNLILKKNLKKHLHPELRKIQKGSLVYAEEYTFEKLWAYLWVRIEGPRHPIPASHTIDEELIETIKRGIVANAPQASAGLQDVILEWIKRNGLDAVLFAIDFYTLEPVDELDLEELGSHIPAALNHLAGAQFYENMHTNKR